MMLVKVIKMGKQNRKLLENINKLEMKDKIQECCMCGGQIEPHYNEKKEPVWFAGHSAVPTMEGRCCNKCHGIVLID